MCARLMQNRVKLFSTAATLFVRRLRLRPQKALSSVADTGCTRLKAISHYKHLGFVLDIELSDDKDILSQLRNINIV